jgi:polyhydroxybutyrate depolymerase
MFCWRLFLPVAALLLPGVAGAAERDRSILAGGLTRSFTMIAPDNVTAPLPLLIVYHGGGQTAERARRYTRFDEGAALENFVVVYPHGLDRQWNDGRVSTDLRQRAGANADDVEFTSQIIAHLQTERMIDAGRVYLTGASNGGMMALRAACELSDRIAGIATVAANLPADFDCRVSRMPALFIHGTDDEFMPFAGGRIAAAKSARDLGEVRSAGDTMGVLKRANACTGVKETKTLDDFGRDKTKAVITLYDCAAAPLKQIVIDGGGHAWPGARESVLADYTMGNISREVDATAEIWAFFKSLPAP